jgi:uncharacterized protein YgiM (DUF1202 family)
MKQLLAVLCTVCILGTCFCLTTASAATTATVTGGWLRMRELPSLDAATLASYYTGTKVTVLSTTGSWSFVQTPDGRTGYMYSSYLNTSSSSSSGSSSSTGTAYVTSSNGGHVAMRTGAGKNYTVLRYLDVGTQVTILSAGSTWNKIQVGSSTGYMMSKYLTSVKPSIVPSSGSGTVSSTAYVTSENGKGVNLRSAPSTDAGVLGKYSVGTQVTILSAGSVWDKIQVGKTVGYMMARYLTAKAPGPVITAAPYTPSVPVFGTAFVTSANGLPVRLRTGPGTNYGILGLFSVGTPVTILSSAANWSQIQIGSLTGYMMTAYLTSGNYIPYPTAAPVIPGGPSNPSVPSNPVVPSVSADPSIVSYVAYVISENGNGVILRSGASTSSEPISIYPVGTQVTVLRNLDTWDYVSVNSTTGYMMHKFLTTAQMLPSSGKINAVAINSSTPFIGETLTATIVPSNATVSYIWTNDKGVQLSTDSSYIVRSSDLGRKIRVKITGIGSYSGTATSGYTSEVISSMTSGSVTKCDLSSTEPTEGDVLYASSDISATVSFIWYRVGGVTLGTGPSYTVQKTDVGSSLYCVAIGYGNWEGSKVSVATKAVKAKAEKLSGTVTLQPQVTKGTKLTANVAVSTSNVTYRWERTKISDHTTVVESSVVSPEIGTAGFDVGDKLQLIVIANSGSGYSGELKSEPCEIK